MQFISLRKMADGKGLIMKLSPCSQVAVCSHIATFFGPVYEWLGILLLLPVINDTPSCLLADKVLRFHICIVKSVTFIFNERML